MHTPSSTIVGALGLAAIATASPAAPASDKSIQYTFDDLVNPVASLAPLVDIDIYKGLNFRMRLGTRMPGLEQVAGIIPHSQPNYAIFGNESTVVDGPATIKPASGTKTFDLRSFWYGCEIAIATDNVNLPLSCNIFVAGYDATGRQTGSATLPFTSNGGTNQSQVLATLGKGFNGLSKVQFEYLSVDELQTGVILDSFSAVLH